MKIIGVSACLLGSSCRYDGSSKANEEVLKLMEDYILIPVCPEILGGLSTPREPSEICGNKVCTASGKDYTSQFEKGALETLKLFKLYNIKLGILKSNSPSCGSDKVYDGSFTGTLVNGQGITTKLLRENGITIISENQLDKLDNI